MSFFKRQYTRIQRYLLERKIGQNPIRRTPGEYQHSRSIGVIFDATSQEHRQIVSQYVQSLKKQHKEVKILAFYDAKQQEPNLVFKHFTHKELNFWRHPQGPQVKEFMAQPFDVLINLFLNEEPALEYLSALSHAQLRVGPYTERTYCYDLMIETADRQNLNRFIEQVEFLLNKMNSTPHETTSA